MGNTNGKWYHTTAELQQKTGLPLALILEHRIIGTFPSIKWGRGWVVPNSCAREFILLAEEEMLPSIWASTRQACSCDALPKGVATLSAYATAQQMGVDYKTVLNRIRAGRIKAYWLQDRWEIPTCQITQPGKQGTMTKQPSESVLQRPSFVADRALEIYFRDHEDVAFLDSGVLTVDGLKKQFGEHKASDFFFGRRTRLQNQTDPLDVQSVCENVRFVQIQAA